MLSRGQEAEIAVTRCDTGLDVTFAMGKALPLVLREKLINFAAENDLVRISWQPYQRGTLGAVEIVVRRLAASITYDTIKVDIPPDSFIQATEEGEAALRRVVLAAVAGSKRVADLYAGCGAFALPVAAQGSHVLAVDSMADQMEALDTAARRAALGEFVRTDRRDLNRRPLMTEELNQFDAVILDPPRSGAQLQTSALAVASVPTVIYASCNPASFARDARILIDGGYELRSVTPVDQFLFSPHTELVAVFLRPV
jgi:23S rRNA (uracil1939-C5)-methyltransferase